MCALPPAGWRHSPPIPLHGARWAGLRHLRATRARTFADAQPIDKEVLAALRFLASAPFEALMTDRLNPLLDSLTEVQDLFVHYHIDRELRVPIFLQHLTSI